MRIRSALVIVTGLALGIAGFTVHSRTAAANKEVAGLWTRWPEARSDGDDVRFYFFHEDGFGLYRYGKIGLNTTNSFDWKVRGDELVLTFKKTGQETHSRFQIVDGGSGRARTLQLVDDPKEPFVQSVSYTYLPPSRADDVMGDLGAGATGKLGDVPGRLWIDQKKFATGGMGFSLYQLKDAAIDGRGVGWFHVGDYDDWTTEALSYRWSGTGFDLAFNVRGERAHVRAQHDGSAHKLTLVDDPRNFWHVRTYVDGGPSFGQLVVR